MPGHYINKDDLAFYEDFFIKNYQLLVAKAFEVCSNWQTAEDVVQDFFIDAWRNQSWKRVRSNFTAYSVKAVQYKAISLLRKQTRLNIHEKNATSEIPEHEWKATGEEIETLEQELKVLAALNSLPEQRKEAFLLAHYHDRSYAEIADRMGISINTVKTHLRLAMQQLRDILLCLLLISKIF